jgi:hypothetical protein
MSGTGLIVALVVETPLMVQKFPAGTAGTAPTANCTLVSLADVHELFSGAVMTTGAGSPMMTFVVAVPIPNGFVHATEIVFVPAMSATVFVLGVVEAKLTPVAALVMRQLVLGGIVTDPSTV